MHLRNTNVGVSLLDSLEVYWSGTFLLVLPTSLPHRLNSLPKTATCVGLVSSINPIHIQNVVSIIVCISAFHKCEAFVTPSLIFNKYLVTSPTNYKHIMKLHDCSHWDPPLYLQFTTREARMLSFNTMLLSGKHSANIRSDAGFFYTGR